MKNTILLFLLLVVFACKKDVQNPAPSSSSTATPVPKLKEEVSYNFTNDTVSGISRTVYTYANNKLVSAHYCDSSGSGFGWSVFNYNLDYSYTSFGKFSQYTISGDFSAVIKFQYDASNTIKYMIQTFMSDEPDTFKFSKVNNSLISKRQSGSSTYLNYYSSNLDSSVALNPGNTRESKAIYSHSQRPDLSASYLNSLSPFPFHANELLEETHLSYLIPNTYVMQYEWSYDQNSRPSKKTTKSNGIKLSETYFTYL